MSIISYDSIADLRAGPVPSTPASALTRGYYAPADGGGGTFAWNSGSTAVDDGGIVIQPTAAPSAGRWILVGEPASLRQFGAKGDGVTNDHDAIARAVASAAGATIAVTPGVYALTTSITITKPFRFEAGGVLKPAAGVTLTMSAPFTAPESRIFDCTAGTVSAAASVRFGRGVTPAYRFEWWGAVADADRKGLGGAVDSTAAIRAAIESAKKSFSNLGGGAFYLPNQGFFLISDEIILPRQQVVDIHGTGQWSGFVFTSTDPGKFALRWEFSATAVSRQNLDNFRISCPNGASGLHMNNLYVESGVTKEGNGFRWMNISRLWIEGSGSSTKVPEGSYGIRLAMLTNSILSDLLIHEFDINVSSYLAGNASGGNTVVQCTASSGVTANWELTSWLSTTFIRLRSESFDYTDPVENPDGRRPVKRGYHIQNSYGNNFIQCSGEDAYEVAGWHLQKCFRIAWLACAMGTGSAPAQVGVWLENVDISQWRSGHVSSQGSGISFKVDAASNGNAFEDVGLEQGFASFVDNGARTRLRLIDMAPTFGNHTVWPLLKQVAGLPIKRVNASGGGVVASDLGMVLVDTAAGPVTFTLNTPPAGVAAGVPLEIINTGPNPLTVQTQGGVNTFQLPGAVGTTTFTLTGRNHRALLRHDGGTVWYGNLLTT